VSVETPMTFLGRCCDLLVGVEPLSPVICWGGRFRSSEEVSIMLGGYGCLWPLLGNAGG
jgi:hypothetical protein